MGTSRYWTILLSLATACATLSLSQADTSIAPPNQPPGISIGWPREGESFSAGTFIKIKVRATNQVGSIARVQLFADTNLIGSISNPPYNFLWRVRQDAAPGGIWRLKAVATDELGASVESAPVSVSYYTGGPPTPIIEIVSPLDGTLLAAPANLDFAAEVLASVGDAGPVEFFVGTNSLGMIDSPTDFSATTPPSSVRLTNLLEGNYKLTVRYRGLNGVYCPCVLNTNTVRVVRLGVHLPSLNPDGKLQFDAVTSFPGKPTVTEVSANLRDWIPISTNVPAGNSFRFVDPNRVGLSERFYRVIVPP